MSSKLLYLIISKLMINNFMLLFGKQFNSSHIHNIIEMLSVDNEKEIQMIRKEFQAAHIILLIKK